MAIPSEFKGGYHGSVEKMLRKNDDFIGMQKYTYIHTYIHTCILTYLLTYLLTYIASHYKKKKQIIT